MKKITFLKMKEWYICFILAFIPFLSNGQCVNNTSYLTPVSNNSGQIQEIGTCTYSTEYNTISGLIVGENYVFTATAAGVDKYVSITDASNVSIAHGSSPLIVNAITAATVRLHVSNSSACDGGSICHVTTVQFLADCPSPVALGVTGLTTTTATANWTAVGPGTAWDLEYGPTGFTLGTGTLVTNLAAATYDFINLTQATTYQFYVRSKCTTEDSLWSSAFSFTTSCLPVTEFSENFDGLTTNFSTTMPICWGRGIVGTPSLYVTTGSALPMSPNNRLYMYVDSGTTPPSEAYAILPAVSNLSAGTHRLRFKAYATAADRFVEVGYLTNPSDLSSFVSIQEVILPSASVAATQQFVVIPPTSIPLGTEYLVIKNPGYPGGSTTVYIDDVVWEIIPSCVEPTGVTVTGVLATTATLNWIAASPAPAEGYEYYVSTSTTNPDGATVATGSVGAGITTAALADLAPITTYYVWVRSVCSTIEKSAWTVIVTFTTPCAATVPDYTQNFSTFLPSCWDKYATGTVATGPTGANNSGSWFGRAFLNGSSGNGAVLNIYSTAPTGTGWLVSPVFDLTAGGYQLKYDVGTTDYFNTAPIEGAGTMGSDDFVYLLMSTDGGATWTTLDTYNTANTPANASTTEIYDVSTVVSANVKFAFYGSSGTTNDALDYDFFIDNFVVQTIPTCFTPTGVNVTGVLATTATLNWTAASPAPAEGYEYYYATTDTPPNGATVPTGSVAAGITTAILPPLTPITTYYVWVRSVCSSADKSSWTSSITFTTPCASSVPDYTQDFATFVPSCWNKYATGTLATGPTGANNSGSWFGRAFLNGSSGNGAVLNIYSTTPTGTGWLVSPVFDLTAGGYQLKYDVGTTDYFNTAPIEGAGTMGSDDFVYVLMSIDGGTTWTTLETYNTANTPANASTTEIYDISTVVSANVKFAFYGSSGTTNDALDYDFFIDNFVVQTIPTTPPACSTNVTAVIDVACGNNATVISWDAAAGSDGYKLTIGTTAGGSDILNNQVVAGLSYEYIGSLNTIYYYTVVPFNVNGDATGCTEQSFTTATTGCYCPSVPTSLDNDGITSIAVGTTNFVNTDVTYTDNTASPVTLMQNVSSPVIINFATGYTYNTYIWIDSNDNYIFDASELLYTGESDAPNPSTLNAAITIPTTTALGAHRMRVVTADGLPSPDSCYSGSYGVTIDFTVNVIEEDLSTGSFDSASFKYYPNPVTDILTVSYSNTISEVVVYSLLGQQVLAAKPNATQTQMDLSGLNTGTYLLKITSDEVTKTVKVVKN